MSKVTDSPPSLGSRIRSLEKALGFAGDVFGVLLCGFVDCLFVFLLRFIFSQSGYS